MKYKSIFSEIHDESPRFKDAFVREYDKRVENLAYDDYEGRQQVVDQLLIEMRNYPNATTSF